METVNKYLVNEGKTSSLIKKTVKKYQDAEIKIAQKFSKEIQKVVGDIYDIEGLESFRDSDLNNLPVSDELKYALADIIEQQIEKMWTEDMQ